MQMNSVYTYQQSFSKTIMSQKSNAADIQYASEEEDYKNDDLLHYEETSMKIKLYDNVLLNKYYQKIKESCTSITLTAEQNTKYKYRPEALSTDQYGFPGLWYLILYVNGCEDFSEFHDLSTVLIPDIAVIQDCLTNEEYIQKKEEI